MKYLTPSFNRFLGNYLLWIGSFAILTYLWQGYYNGDWWKIGYFESLLIPISIMMVFIWYGFVPKKLGYSDEKFEIDNFMNGKNSISWSELKYHGYGRGVYMIEFNGTDTFQISKWAYSKNEWFEFMNFLTTHFPDKKATGYFGNKMFKWRK